MYFNGSQWPAGDIEVCVEKADYNSLLQIEGVRGRKVKIRAGGDAEEMRPNFRAGVLIRNSSGITLSKLNVSRSVDPTKDVAALLIDAGSENNIVEYVNVDNAMHGIAIGGSGDPLTGPAGAGNIIRNNGVGGNIALNGITIGKNSGSKVEASHQTVPFGTLIDGNTVSGNGGHGIDVDNSGKVKITNNVVANNGYTDKEAGGYSGIHLYTASDNGTCNSNQVLYNYVWGTVSRRGGTDGNGIQIDNFCDDNAVGYNVIWNNDGAGIAVYNAARNQVFSNTVGFNSMQEMRAVEFDPKTSAVGEIVLSACVDRNTDASKNTCVDARPHGGRTRENWVYNNIVHSSVMHAPAINVHITAVKDDTDAKLDLKNKIGPNMYSNSGVFGDPNWPLLIFGNGSYAAASSAEIDALTKLPGNLVEVPAVAGYDLANPAAVYKNNTFQLVRQPTKHGEKFADRADWMDILKEKPTANSNYFGAYYNVKSN